MEQRKRKEQSRSVGSRPPTDCSILMMIVLMILSPYNSLYFSRTYHLLSFQREKEEALADSSSERELGQLWKFLIPEVISFLIATIIKIPIPITTTSPTPDPMIDSDDTPYSDIVL